jgi:hypothetical protein
MKTVLCAQIYYREINLQSHGRAFSQKRELKHMGGGGETGEREREHKLINKLIV